MVEYLMIMIFFNKKIIIFLYNKILVMNYFSLFDHTEKLIVYFGTLVY